MAKQVKPDVETFARIKVVGVGGSGNNAINHMIECGIKGVEFIAVNTDAQDLHHSEAGRKIHIGKNLTKGLGTGMNPELGRQAAEETKEEMQEVKHKLRAELIVITKSEEEGRIGIVIDELISEQDIVVKPLKGVLKQSKGFAGITLLGDGKPALILDTSALL